MVYGFENIGPDDLEKEKGYKPSGIKKITKSDLATTGQSGYKRNTRRLVNSSPDMQQNAKLTFLYENNLHKKHPDKVDILGWDAKNAPKVDKLPFKGWKGQVVDYKGKLFVAGSEFNNGTQGKFKASQRTMGDYTKGQAIKQQNLSTFPTKITTERQFVPMRVPNNKERIKQLEKSNTQMRSEAQAYTEKLREPENKNKKELLSMVSARSQQIQLNNELIAKYKEENARLTK